MIPFSPPHIDDDIILEVVDALKSGWITTGPKTKKFERNITEYCGTQATICLNSGTAAMELMLQWFGVGPGDEVIVPAYTYTATANVVVHTGAKVVMCDVLDDFTIDPQAMKKLITKKTKVIMPVDIGGWPCDFDTIFDIIREDKIKSKFTPRNENQELMGRIMVLCDGAHSIGSMYKGEKSAVKADATTFSFHAVKNLTTAEGGALTLNLPDRFDPERIYKDLCVKSLHGQTKDAFAKVQKGGWRYDVVEAGYKYNMTDIQASIGLVELARYDEVTLKRRREIFDLYSKALASYDWANIPVYENEERRSNYHLYLLRINGSTEEQRNRIIYEIFEQDVSVNVHYQPLPMLSVYKHKGYKMENYPVAYKNYSQEISLPVYFDLTDENVVTVVEAVVNAVNKVMFSE